MPRLIDADALKQAICMDECGEETSCGACRWVDFVDDAPTVNILQKLWNALYTEEDKFEKRYIGTQEHDNWFSVYRPWLQDGFGIAIKVLSEIFAPEPPKEENSGSEQHMS